MEGETGVSLFPWIAQKAGTALNFDELWAQIRAVPHTQIQSQPGATDFPGYQSCQR
jgi:hypothetical protein